VLPLGEGSRRTGSGAEDFGKMFVVIDAERPANVRAPDGDAIVAGARGNGGAALAREARLRVAGAAGDSREEDRDRAQRLTPSSCPATL
jgi:hypothetical protein